MAHRFVTLLVAILFSSCTEKQPEGNGDPIVDEKSAADEAVRSLGEARATLSSIPERELVFRAVRDFTILRQVEESDDLQDWKTRRDAADARDRSHQVMLQVSTVIPLLQALQDDCLDLRGALFRLARDPDTDPERVNEIGSLRARLGELVANLDIAILALSDPSSFYPPDAYYFDPQFEEAFTELESTLAKP
ncbi:MAG: hypothetical protein AAGI48_05300 [Verrucomicrobiota bacterium]